MWRSAVLTATLLFAQVLALSHVDTDDSHAAGEACAVCIVHAGLDSANVVAEIALQFERSQPDTPEFRPAPAPVARIEAAAARGPPTRS